MAQIFDPTLDNVDMDEGEKRAYPEVQDMVAEYEKSPQYLEDCFQQTGLERRKQPLGCANTSPLEHHKLLRKMSLEPDTIEIAPPAVSIMSTISLAASNQTTTTSSAAAGISPRIKTHPTVSAKRRPAPNPNNPWYTRDLEPAAVENHLHHILKSVRLSVQKWNLECDPSNFRNIARKAHKNWDTTGPELRRMCVGLQELCEFLVCGPKEWLLAHALPDKSLEGLRDVVQDIVPLVNTLASIDGCGWLGEKMGGPSLRIDQQLAVLLAERKEYKDRLWAEMSSAEKLPYNIADMTMGAAPIMRFGGRGDLSAR